MVSSICNSNNLVTSNLLKVTIRRNDDFIYCNNQRDCFKLLYIVSGNGVISLNNKKVPISPMTVICLSDKDQVFLNKANNFVMHSIYFDPAIVNSTLTIQNLDNVSYDLFDEITRSDLAIVKSFLSCNIQTKVFQVTEIVSMQISLLLEKMEYEITGRSNDFWLFSIRLFICQILFLVKKSATNDPLPIIEIPDTSKDVEKIVLYLHTYFHTHITLNLLAHEFKTNRTTISNNFKKTFKMTIMVYLTKIRIQAAAYLLKNTNLSVFEIASQTGFVDLPHFSRTFKKYWDYTPGDFRNSFNPKISEPKINSNFRLTYNDFVSTKI